MSVVLQKHVTVRYLLQGTFDNVIFLIDIIHLMRKGKRS